MSDPLEPYGLSGGSYCEWPNPQAPMQRPVRVLATGKVDDTEAVTRVRDAFTRTEHLTASALRFAGMGYTQAVRVLERLTAQGELTVSYRAIGQTRRRTRTYQLANP